MEFTAGDVVQLKSGGPIMTIEQVGELAMTGGQAVWCTWFEKVGGKRVVQRETFHPSTLAKANPGVASIRVVRG